MIRTAITLAIFVLSGSAGELAVTHGMKKAGAPMVGSQPCSGR